MRYHEQSVCFLQDGPETGLPEKGEKFTLRERHHTHEFEWLAFERLKDEYFNPVFPKTGIYDLECYTMRTENECGDL